MNRDIIAFTKYKFNVYGKKDIRSGRDSAVVGIVGKSKSLDFPTMLIFWSLVRNSVVLAVYLLFSVACFLTVHEHYSMESGDKTENMNTLQDYESYGIVYHPKDGYWYYNDQIIGIFIDTKKPIIYFNNSGSIYLSIAENSENGVMEIKEISEAEAQKLLRDNNSGNSASFTVETLK